MTATTQPLALSERTPDSLWQEREDLRLQIAELAAKKGAIEQEVARRAGDLSAGPKVVTGDRVLLTVRRTTTYETVEEAVLELEKLQSAETGPPLMTPAEYNQLVTWGVVKYNRVVHNALMKRGGAVAEALARCQTLKGTGVEITPKARAS